LLLSVNAFIRWCQPINEVLLLVAIEDASVWKAANQSGTLEDHFARYAVDGNNSTTDLSKCASAFFHYDQWNRISCAWWQVNLGDFYLVKAITVFFPTVRPG